MKSGKKIKECKHNWVDLPEEANLECNKCGVRMYEKVEQEPTCGDQCHANGNPVHCQSCQPKTEGREWTEEELERDAKRVAATFTPEELGEPLKETSCKHKNIKCTLRARFCVDCGEHLSDYEEPSNTSWEERYSGFDWLFCNDNGFIVLKDFIRNELSQERKRIREGLTNLYLNQHGKKLKAWNLILNDIFRELDNQGESE